MSVDAVATCMGIIESTQKPVTPSTSSELQMPKHIWSDKPKITLFSSTATPETKMHSNKQTCFITEAI
jgi:hypothetical protein